MGFAVGVTIALLVAGPLAGWWRATVWLATERENVLGAHPAGIPARRKRDVGIRLA